MSLRSLGLALAATLALAACGRIGPPVPPGPREAITYPRAYPRWTDLPVARPAPTPAAAIPAPGARP